MSKRSVPLCSYMEVSRPYKTAFRSLCEKLKRVSDILDLKLLVLWKRTPQISYLLEVERFGLLIDNKNL